MTSNQFIGSYITQTSFNSFMFSPERVKYSRLRARSISFDAGGVKYSTIRVETTNGPIFIGIQGNRGKLSITDKHRGISFVYEDLNSPYPKSNSFGIGNPPNKACILNIYTEKDENSVSIHIDLDDGNSYKLQCEYNHPLLQCRSEKATNTKANCIYTKFSSH